MGNKSRYIQFDERFLEEVEEFGAVLCSFSTEAYMLNPSANHEVWVYELDKRKFWVRKFEGRVVEFREIT
jgi:hypothetical protein